MKISSKLIGLTLVALLTSIALIACGDPTTTPVPVTAQVAAPTQLPTNTPQPTSTIAPAAKLTVITDTPTLSTPLPGFATVTVTTAFPTPLPAFATNQEMADKFKAGPNVEEIQPDIALLSAIKLYFNNDPELVIKLFVLSGEPSRSFGFDSLRNGYYPESPTVENSVNGSIFDAVFVRSASTGDRAEDFPQMAIYVPSLEGNFLPYAINELNHFSQNRLDTGKLLTQLQGKKSLELLVFGKHLLSTINSKRVPEATLTPVPALAITPSGKPVLIKENDPFEGELKIYKLVYDSSQSYTSIKYVFQAKDTASKSTATLTYTAVKPRQNDDNEQELDTDWTSDSFSDRVIIAEGLRYENLNNKGWVQGEYHGLSEGDYSTWGRAYAKMLPKPSELEGYNFTLFPDETFKGQTVGSFTLEKPGENKPKYTVRYNKQTYKPVQILFSYSNSQSGVMYIDYEYNNPTWKIEKPANWVVATPTPAPTR